MAKDEKSELVKQVLDINFKPVNTDIEARKQEAVKIPFDDIAALGIGLASIPEVFRTATQTLTVPNSGLLQAFDKAGNLADINTLSHFNDGTGMMGSRIHPTNGFEQIRFMEAGSQTMSTSVTMPYDPTTLFMAAALMQINEKLDAIQKTQQEMFDYLKDKDKAELRGNLETLARILEEYNFNWNNETYKKNKHLQVQGIRQSAEQTIIQHHANIERKLDDGGLFHLDKDVDKRVDDLLESLQEYRLAVYIFAFSSFMEVMLLENFDAGYLESVCGSIEKKNLQYLEMYTKSYNLIEQMAESSLEQAATRTFSGIEKAIGGLLAKTPIGKNTELDEKLIHASKRLGVKAEMGAESKTKNMLEARTADTKPFSDNIKMIDRLHNEPMGLYLDEQAVYMVPLNDDDVR